jgi:hypothetical protein
MPKTWTPINDTKLRKAFERAMRELLAIKRGRRYPRPQR